MLPRAKTRRLTIDCVRYTYAVTEYGTCVGPDIPLVVNVQSRDSNGQTLRILGVCIRRVPQEVSKFYRGRSVEVSLIPNEVALMIRAALVQGYNPAHAGPVFVMQVSMTSHT